MTMVLPLAFAACTSDEFESQGADINLAQRTEIGQVDLSFDLGDAQTRWDGNLMEEVSDALGAALIDAPKETPVKDPTKGKWETDYDVKSYISTNYPYTYNGERWTSPAKLVEGSYLFYAPYAENHQVRSAIKYAAPVVQNLKVENGQVVEMSAVADMAENFKSPFYFGYKFFDATDDNRNISLGLRHIFAYPKFTLKNTTGEDVTITRIVLQSNDLNIPASGEFDNAAIAKAMNTEEKSWGADQSLNMQYHLTTASLLKSGETQVPTNLVRADLSEAVTIADDEEITFSIVMPAMKFDQNKLTVYFVTESGQGYEFRNGTSTIELVPGRRYPTEDYNLNGTLKGAAGELLTMTVTEKTPLKSVPYIVTSTQELINTIDATPSNLETELELTIGGDVEFNEDVLTAIAENLSQPVVFKGAIDIVGSADATKPLDINQKVEFDEATVSGNVKFNNNAIAYNKVTVEKDAALEVAVVNATGANANIINNGTLTLKAAVKAVENNGTLNVETNGSFTTLSSENEEPTQKVNINGIYKLALDKIVGEWTVTEGATLTLDAATTTLPYKSTLTVNGKLNGKALTVSGTMNLNGDLDADVVVNGVMDDKTTATVNEAKPAVINVGSKADVTSAISGDGTNGEKRDVQTVNLPEDFIEFFGSCDNTNLMVKYTHEGNITKGSDIKVPSIANNVTIDGSIAGVAGDKEKAELGGVKFLTITGNIQTVDNTFEIVTAESAEVTIEGNVRMSKTLRMDQAGMITIDGDVYSTEKGGLKAAKIDTIYANNFRIAGNNEVGNWDIDNLKRIYLQGETRVNQKMEIPTDAETYISGDMIIADGMYFDISEKTYIRGNITISGAGMIAGDGATISIEAGYTLTNSAVISGTPASNGGTGVGIESLEKAGKTRGQFVNNGTVQYTDAKTGLGEFDWWKGSKVKQ